MTLCGYIDVLPIWNNIAVCETSDSELSVMVHLVNMAVSSDIVILSMKSSALSSWLINS